MLPLEDDQPVAIERSKQENLDEEVHVWPNLVFKEFLCALFVVLLLVVFSQYVDAPLEEIANPSKTPNPAKAPWYFVGLQELLVYFDPWIAGVMLPGMIIVGLMAIPYIDIHREGRDQYQIRKRPVAVTAFLFGFAMWFLLIAIGQYLRGPSWNIYWPWEDWTAHKPAVPPLESLPFWSGLAFISGYVLLGMNLPLVFIKRSGLAKIGAARYSIVMFLALTMFFVPVKVLMRLFFDVKYIIETPWFNI